LVPLVMSWNDEAWAYISCGLMPPAPDEPTIPAISGADALVPR
jgi:hypothetical protein